MACRDFGVTTDLEGKAGQGFSRWDPQRDFVQAVLRKREVKR
jgi:hypothetical protein